jgi:hypothetical protein
VGETIILKVRLGSSRIKLVEFHDYLGVASDMTMAKSSSHLALLAALGLLDHQGPEGPVIINTETKPQPLIEVSDEMGSGGLPYKLTDCHTCTRLERRLIN